MHRVIEKVRKEKVVVITMGVLFCIAFLYNTYSPYTTDDYTYMFSFKDGARITNPTQIFSSLWAHYMNIHGRILPHVFVQFFAMFPKWIFNLVNAAVYVGILYTVLQTACRKKLDVLMLIALSIVFWRYIPAYGSVFLWMTGSANYSWAFLLALFYMKVYIGLYTEPERVVTNRAMLLFSICSFLFGAYSEIVSFPVVFICFLLLCVTIYEEKKIERYWKYGIPIVTAAAGYLTMLVCPAQVRIKDGLSVSLIFKNLLDVFETYYQCTRELLIIWAILFALTIWFKGDKKLRVIAICFLLISVISMMMLSAASYIAARHFATPVFFLIVSLAILMQTLREKGSIECVNYCICAYVIAANLWSLWEGTYDIYDVYRRCEEREAYICEQVEQGNDEILNVPLIIPLTKYSCKYDLVDLRTDDSDSWPNAEIAAYYGLKKIYGIRE